MIFWKMGQFLHQKCEIDDFWENRTIPTPKMGK